jgi:MFS family permease
MNYTSIAALHAAHNSIQPLFLAMPIQLGGLGLPPRQVGYILGTYGITNSIFQTFMLGRLVRRFGVKSVFVTAIAAFVPMFTFSPLMNILVRKGGFSYIVWGMLGLQLSSSLVMELGYGAFSHTSE